MVATGDDEDNLVVSLLAKRRYGAPRVVAVVRGERVLPGGGGPLEPGDEVLAVTALAVEPALRRAIGGQAGGSHVPGG